WTASRPGCRPMRGRARGVGAPVPTGGRGRDRRQDSSGAATGPRRGRARGLQRRGHPPAGGCVGGDQRPSLLRCPASLRQPRRGGGSARGRRRRGLPGGDEAAPAPPHGPPPCWARPPHAGEGGGGGRSVRNFLPFIVVGITAGSVYGLAGLGLVLTYRTSGVFNFAHGALATAGSYVFYDLWTKDPVPWPL